MAMSDSEYARIVAEMTQTKALGLDADEVRGHELMRSIISTSITLVSARGSGDAKRRAREIETRVAQLPVQSVSRHLMMATDAVWRDVKVGHQTDIDAALASLDAEVAYAQERPR